MGRKFLAFAGDQFYPNGGTGDYVGAFDDLQSAFDKLEDMQRAEWWEDQQWCWAEIALWDGERFLLDSRLLCTNREQPVRLSDPGWNYQWHWTNETDD
jgi:hypothetical protein